MLCAAVLELICVKRLACAMSCCGSVARFEAIFRAFSARRTLGALAEKCHAFAKALHYKEVEFAQTPETAVESLISINNQLRQPEAAIGILAVAQNDLHMELKVTASNTIRLLPLTWPLEYLHAALSKSP